MSNATLQLTTFRRPYDWDAVQREMETVGAAILERLLTEEQVRAVNEQSDAYFAADPGAGVVQTGIEIFDEFLGKETKRMYSLITEIPATISVLGSEELAGWAERAMEQRAASVLLASGEFIQINSGETVQGAHRDSVGWPDLPRGEHPFVMNAMVAFDDFTLENGATYVAPGSWEWPDEREALPHEFARAVMPAGSAMLFRGDSIHHGGENTGGQRRRAISVAYCAGWLRTPENHFLNIPIEVAKTLPEKLQALLGYAPYDGTERGGAVIGVAGIDGGDPWNLLVE
ncbi:MAG: phytanoyl-CoA dioxygenase family protein [Actinomycetota bacterium]